MTPACVRAVLIVALLALPSAVRPQAAPPTVRETSLTLPDGSVLRYGLSVPEGYEESREGPRPLVLVLHPGGRSEYYGSSFMQQVVEPALRSWRAVIVAPDVPDRSWATVGSERAVLGLIQHAFQQHAIDRGRVLVTGFSMGGGGSWYFAARHPELFTGAIVMAGSAGGADLEALSVPIYLIHSPDDEVVPFAAAEDAYRALAARDHPVELRVLPGLSHYMMGAYIPALRLAGSWMLERWLEAAR
jgi:predicted peptidase